MKSSEKVPFYKKKRAGKKKKGGYFKLSAENISTSILSAFHPISLYETNFKVRKRYLFSV